MPRYHINIYNDQDIADVEGSDVKDLAAAKAMAIEGARAMMAEHLTAGRPVNLGHRIEITDHNGKVLATLPFREMVTITDR